MAWRSKTSKPKGSETENLKDLSKASKPKTPSSSYTKKEVNKMKNIKKSQKKMFIPLFVFPAQG